MSSLGFLETFYTSGQNLVSDTAEYLGILTNRFYLNFLDVVPPTYDFFYQEQSETAPVEEREIDVTEYNGKLNDLIDLELSNFKKFNQVDSDKHFTQISFGRINVDPGKLNITFDNGGLSALEYEFQRNEFILSITNVTGIEKIFRVVIDFEFTTENDNIVEKTYETWISIAKDVVAIKKTINKQVKEEKGNTEDEDKS